jgi:hypothetical protein
MKLYYYNNWTRILIELSDLQGLSHLIVMSGENFTDEEPQALRVCKTCPRIYSYCVLVDGLGLIWVWFQSGCENMMGSLKWSSVMTAGRDCSQVSLGTVLSMSSVLWFNPSTMQCELALYQPTFIHGKPGGSQRLITCWRWLHL